MNRALVGVTNSLSVVGYGVGRTPEAGKSSPKHLNLSQCLLGLFASIKALKKPLKNVATRCNYWRFIGGSGASLIVTHPWPQAPVFAENFTSPQNLPNSSPKLRRRRSMWRPCCLCTFPSWLQTCGRVMFADLAPARCEGERRVSASRGRWVGFVQAVRR